MKHCLKCNTLIPTWDKQNGKTINTQRRKFCFNCSPYKSHNTRDLTKTISKKSGSDAVKRWRQNLKKRMISAMGGECQCCGYNRCDNAMEFHHLNKNEKETIFGGIRGHPRAWSVVVKELRKCVLLCCLCHREVEAGIRTIPDSAKKFDERWANYQKMEKWRDEGDSNPRSSA